MFEKMATKCCVKAKRIHCMVLKSEKNLVPNEIKMVWKKQVEMTIKPKKANKIMDVKRVTMLEMISFFRESNDF